MKNACFALIFAAAGILAPARAQEPAPTAAPAAIAPAAITFLPLAGTAPISAGVTVPAGTSLFMTSGTVPPVADETAPPGSPERYGDTKTQGEGALRQIEVQLKKVGLGLGDVIYLRVYVTADKTKGGKIDFPGWFEAYGQFFGTAQNPVKPARSTVGIASLVNPDLLIEIEAVAAKAQVLPEVKAPTAKESQNVQHPGECVLNIAADGRVVLDQQTLGLDELKTKLKQLSDTNPDQAVVVRGDERVDYKHVVAVLDTCRAANIWNVAFATAKSGAL
jgi:enamine deaminase RidA (YjgF/YER057c/UK114 family)